MLPPKPPGFFLNLSNTLRLITDRSLVSLFRPFYSVSLLLNQPRLYSFVSRFVFSSFNFSLASHESRSKTIGVSSHTKKAFLRACPVIDHETPPISTRARFSPDFSWLVRSCRHCRNVIFSEISPNGKDCSNNCC